MSVALSITTIPDAERPAFHSLPSDLRDEIKTILAIIARVDTSDNVRQAMCSEANAMRGRRGFSMGSIARKRTLYHRAGYDWTVFVDRTRVPDWDDQRRRRTGNRTKAAIPPEFFDHVRALFDQNHRKFKPAYRALVRQWRAGEEVPGFGSWREWFMAEYPDRMVPDACPPDLPTGWGYRNLLRHMPCKVERALVQRGVSAARNLLPREVGTRDGLRFMELVVLDDWRSDFRVCHPGVDHPCQLNGMLALDVACALAMRFGLRPALPRQDGSEEGLRRRDTKELIARLLTTYGYPLDYTCNIVLERGTATIAQADADALYDLTNGQVRVSYTTMISGSVFGFKDRPVGNYLGKAWIESYFNLLHNEAAALPGQIGARYQLSPAATQAKMTEARGLVRAGKFLPPELRQQFKLPFLSTAEADQSHNVIFNRLNNRTDHNLESFLDVMEWREEHLDKWRPMEALIGVSQELMDSIITRTRLETPWERYQRLSQGVRFQKLPTAALPCLLESHRKVRVEKEGDITFQVDGKRIVFRDLDNPALVEGAEYLAYYDSQVLDWIHLTDGKGAYVTSVARYNRVVRGDVEAIKAGIADKQRQLNRKIASVQGRNAHILQQRSDDLDTNLALVAQVQASILPETDGESDSPNAIADSIRSVYEAQADLATTVEDVESTSFSSEDLAAATHYDRATSNEPELSEDDIAAALSRS